MEQAENSSVHMYQRHQTGTSTKVFQFPERSMASLLALNSAPGFHSGSTRSLATVYPSRKKSCESSTAPLISQSARTSSDGLW